jgi:hypothetical protein
MDIIAEPSRGLNIVAESKALAPYFPAATVDAAFVEVFWQEVDEETDALIGVPNTLGRMPRGAAGSFQYTPVANKKVRLFALPYNAFGVPAVDELEDATTHDIDFSTEATAPGLDSVDAHVPLVTVAPTVTKAENTDDWVIFYPKPDDYGYSLVASEVQVRRDSDDVVISTPPNGVSNRIQLAQAAFDCKVRYRWQNNSMEDAGDGRGWSDWSPDTAAPGLGSATAIAPETTVTAFVSDPHDVHNPSTRKTAYAEEIS